MSVEELEVVVSHLSPKELARFSEWFRRAANHRHLICLCYTLAKRQVTPWPSAMIATTAMLRAIVLKIL